MISKGFVKMLCILYAINAIYSFSKETFKRQSGPLIMKKNENSSPKKIQYRIFFIYKYAIIRENVLMEF